MQKVSQDMPETVETLTLQRWRKRLGLSQAHVATQMLRLAPAVLPHPLELTQLQLHRRISRIEGGHKPPRDLMLLIYVLSHGVVDANGLYELGDWRRFKHALEVLPEAEIRSQESGVSPSTASGSKDQESDT